MDDIFENKENEYFFHKLAIATNLPLERMGYVRKRDRMRYEHDKQQFNELVDKYGLLEALNKQDNG